MPASIDDFRGITTDSATLALFEFAEKITRDTTQMTKDDIDSLRNNGFSDDAILDAACVASYFNYINRMSDALGVELEEIFERTNEAKL